MKLPGSSFLRSRRGLAVLAVLLIVGLFLFRPGVYRLRNRISSSIGSALGRRVSIDNVHVHVLPRPGFDLEGLVIYDDPNFSAEPMIRAEDVSAAIRLRSLLRGRIEIAHLSANEPSINLVRNEQGRWNLASLLERNAQIPAAPTAKAASEWRPAFPYLEASNARVNFKLGQTKKSYALMNADVALWQDSENSWGARIKAEPVRTDFHLTDTGLVQINATWQRSLSLRQTPLEITAQWRKGQLGQITQLLSGKDRGWRGELNLQTTLSGTPEALRIKSQTAIEDFRRYDIVDTESVHLGTACAGSFNAVSGKLADLLCESPVGGGALRVRGSASLFAQPPAYDLTLEAEKFPVTSLVRLLRHAKKQIPGDVSASGLLNAEFRTKFPLAQGTENVSHTGNRFHPSAGASGTREVHARWTGTGSATNMRLTSKAGENEVAFGSIPMAVVSASDVRRTSNRVARHEGQVQSAGYVRPSDSEPAEAHLRIGPVTLAVNGSAPLTASGWISASGYLLSLRGDSELKDLFSLQRLLGVPSTQPAAEGSARLDLSVTGAWQGFAPPTIVGAAQLRNVRADVRGFNAPVEITSANVFLTPDAVRLQKMTARTGNTHWSGTVLSPRHCSTASGISDLGPEALSKSAAGAIPGCVLQFDLAADQLSAGEIAEWLTPHPARRPWYRILNSSDPASVSNSNPNDPLNRPPLMAIQGHGTLHVARFGLKKVVATQVVTQVDIDRGKVTLNDLRAQLLHGSYQGHWTLDASRPHDDAGEARTATETDQSAPFVRYHGTGTLQNISLEQVSALMNDSWIDGTGEGTFDLSGSASDFSELSSRSEGKLSFVMRSGSLAHVEIPGLSAPLPVHRFSGELRLRKGAWELSAGKMESRDGFFQVRGSLSPETGCDFVLARSDEQAWELTGTLDNPQAAPLDQTQAKGADVNATSVKQ